MEVTGIDQNVIFIAMRRHWIILLFILNGLSLLTFRYVPSLDGPLHITRAHMLQQQWDDAKPGSQGLFYTLPPLERIGPLDLVAMGLIKVTTAEKAQQVIIALLVLLLGCALVMLARAYGSTVSPLLLLALPLTFNILTLFGFFNFILAIALSFIALAWWTRQKEFSKANIIKLLAIGTLLFWVHRGGPFLFIVLFAGHEFANWQSRYVKRSQKVIILSLLVIAGVAAIFFLAKTRIEPADARSPLHDLLNLRSMMMVDQQVERWFMLGWGVLFLGALGSAIARRTKTAEARAKDGLWVSALLLLGASTAIQTHGAYLFYFSERAQVVALLLLAIWAATMIRNSQIAIVIGALAFGVHITRQVFLEHRMSLYGEVHEQVMQATEHLTPKSVLIPLMEQDDWLFEHKASWFMIAHDGMVLSKQDRFWYERGTPEAEHFRRTVKGKVNDVRLLKVHLESGYAPQVLEILLNNNGALPAGVDPVLLNDLLEQHFDLKFSNERVKLYERR